ncbi:MAG: universal stress protein [Solirubrobacterales bacterium]|nr:universal stress protein [Solirubrobacterales bacterium]
MFANVVIGVDGRDCGRDPVRLARELCAEGAKLTLARFHRDYRNLDHAVDKSLRDTERQIAETLLARAAALNKLDVTKAVGAATVHEAFSEYCRESRADLLVIGSGRHAAPGRVDVANWLTRVVSRAPCAVAVAPRGYKSHHGAIRQIGVPDDGSEETRQALAIARRMASHQGAGLSILEGISAADFHRSAYAWNPTGWVSEKIQSLDLLVLPADAEETVRLLHPSVSRALLHGAHAPLLIVTRAAGIPRWGDQTSHETHMSDALERA